MAWEKFVLANGDRIEHAMISALDMGFTRGVGVFEVLKAYSGRVFSVDRHLERLEGSARSVGFSLAPRDLLQRWIEEVGAEGGDCLVRMMCTPGEEGAKPAPTTIVHSFPLISLPPVMRLATMTAHWHPAGDDWELVGAKTLSYAPNMTALRVAQEQGFDDAILISRENVILECPRSAFGWVRNGVVEFPTLKLGVLNSVTRQHAEELVLGMGIELQTGVFDLAVLQEASEVFMLSTAKEVSQVTQVGGLAFEPGPISNRIEQAIMRRVQLELDLPHLPPPT